MQYEIRDPRGNSLFQKGDLVSLVPIGADKKNIILGSMSDDDLLSDPSVPEGTVCMVQGMLEDPNITSESAYVVIMEHAGRLKNYWVYSSEMSLVVRP